MSWDKVPKRRGLRLVPECSLELGGRAVVVATSVRASRTIAAVFSTFLDYFAPKENVRTEQK